MKQVLRRALTGLLCGTFLSPVLCLAFRDAGLGVGLGAILGIVEALAFFDLEGESALNHAMTSGAPLHVRPRQPGSSFSAEVSRGSPLRNTLKKLFRDDPAVCFTLISETNSWLFTPMLVEVATSSLEPTHITAPLRTSLKRTRVLRSRITGIDLDSRQIQVNGELETGLLYDHLVLALGSVSDCLNNPAVAENAFGFKTLADAIHLRNHVIDVFERADGECDAERRQALLTFVIAGGGFSGSELAGGLNDFARGIIADYTNLSATDLRIILVHSRERILPELSESLAAYAVRRMRERGVTFKLCTRVTDASPGSVTLSSGKKIPSAAAGLAGGLVCMPVIAAVNGLPVLAGLVGDASPLVGAGVHLAADALLGMG